MTVIDNVGKVKDMGVALDNINRFTSDDHYISEFELEEIFRNSDVIKLYDKNGHQTANEVEAIFKIIELKDVFSIYDGFQVCVSLVKSPAQVARWGHVSDEVWLGLFVGSEEKLYSKWLNKQQERAAMELVNTSDGMGCGTLGSAMGEETIAKLKEMAAKLPEATNTVEDVPVRPPSDYTDFLEEVYDLLYMKESWKDVEGKLSRLYRYFNYLAIKVVQDPDRAKYMEFNKRKDKVMFNSRLLSKYGNYIIISCNNYGVEFSNYKVVRSIEDAANLGFESTLDIPPISFFRQLDEVVFKGTIDDFDVYNMHRLYHVIEERKHRLPKDMQKMSSIDINMRLMASVEMALKIAQTDYKFIVPMYNKEMRRIQFLMPVYSSFDGESKPECALVVDKNEHNKWEIRTVLEMEAAYGNARLINRPDQNWLSIDEKPVKKTRKPQTKRTKLITANELVEVVKSYEEPKAMSSSDFWNIKRRAKHGEKSRVKEIADSIRLLDMSIDDAIAGGEQEQQLIMKREALRSQYNAYTLIPKSKS